MTACRPSQSWRSPLWLTCSVIAVWKCRPLVFLFCQKFMLYYLFIYMIDWLIIWFDWLLLTLNIIHEHIWWLIYWFYSNNLFIILNKTLLLWGIFYQKICYRVYDKGLKSLSEVKSSDMNLNSHAFSFATVWSMRLNRLDKVISFFFCYASESINFIMQILIFSNNDLHK